MKETTKKGYYHENIHDRKDVVKILDIIEHESGNPHKTVIIYRKVHPLLKAVSALNAYVLDFEFTFGTKKTYASIGSFEEKYTWFVADAHTEARLREGFYDNN
jgi:hypothetical protein